MGHALFHAGAGDLIEGHPVLGVRIQAQNVGQVPGDGLSFPVRVRGQQHAVGLGGSFLQLFHQLFLAFDDGVLGLEVVLHVHAEAGLGQIPHVSHRGHHFIAASQIFLNGLRLGGRFHNYQFCHWLSRSFFRPRRAQRVGLRCLCTRGSLRTRTLGPPAPASLGSLLGYAYLFTILPGRGVCQIHFPTHRAPKACQQPLEPVFPLFSFFKLSLHFPPKPYAPVEKSPHFLSARSTSGGTACREQRPPSLGFPAR